MNGEFDLRLPVDRIRAAHNSGYADELFKVLGARTVESFDYSDYEGATHVHDFNTPVPRAFHGQYSFLIDGGTLEHVFHFPIALKSCMKMLKIGGTYFGATPANNEMGHGFYQLSPELYFRAFSPANGFQTDAIYLYEGRESRRWFRVADPEVIRRRAEKVNCKSTYLLVRGTKTSDADVFATSPLQPDYVSQWESRSDHSVAGDELNVLPEQKSFLRRIASHLPYGMKRRITMSRVAVERWVRDGRMHLGVNADHEVFQPFDPRDD
ncbi:hypothetical protein [Allorhodopirellula solitaria]|uniref:hypothetical protein n=1 Tax=Allorhodopirellula solitaria TaxID=2527987 RepID=UPI0016486164|nr:hypothetical protein [Allorhodopirellula solitaria]